MKFYYLREFSTDNGFDKLSVLERLVLSAVLTKRLNEDDRDLVQIIMNFDGSLDYTPYSNWMNYKDFVKCISDFLNKQKGHLSDFVLKNSNNKSVLHYVSLNYSDLQITGKHAMTTIACKAFILGASNHSVNDNNDWFTFNLFQWSKCTATHKKRSLQEIQNFADRHNVFIQINGNRITVLNKRKQEAKRKESLDVPDEDKEVKEYQQKIQKEIEQKHNDIQKTSFQQIIDSKIESSFEPQDALNLGDDRLTIEGIKHYHETHQSNYQNFNFFSETKFNKWSTELNNYIHKIVADKDVKSLLSSGRVQGNENWQQRKDLAVMKIQELQQKLLKGLNNVYDRNRNGYLELLNWVCKCHWKLFQF